jgi:putative hydrolase of the HAD superfamily
LLSNGGRAAPLAHDQRPFLRLLDFPAVNDFAFPKTCVILDFGGVISCTPFERHRATERVLDLPPGTLTWLGPLAPDTDELWRRMIADEISEREYWRLRAREVGRLVGEDWHDMQSFIRRIRGDDPNQSIRPEADAFIREAKRRGKRLAVLSNELDLFYGREFRERIEILQLMDTIVDGTYTNTLKPRAEAYLNCLKTLGVPVEEAVFIDDQPRNVAGARLVGLDAVQFDVRDPAASYAEAERYLYGTARARG